MFEMPAFGMGTAGYTIYRHRNMYFTYRHYINSHLKSFGVQMLQCLPGTIAMRRQELEEILDKTNGQSFPLRYHDDLSISDERPNTDCLGALWVYGIDLDHNISRVNGIPFYSLDCLPEHMDFLEHIAEDHYLNLACEPECPPKHKYKRPAGPVVDDSDLETYQSLACTSPHAALSDLLDINDTLSTDEQVRISLLEMIIGWCIKRLSIGQLVYDFEFTSNHNQVTDDEWLMSYSLASFAFAPQIFHTTSASHTFAPHLNRKEFTWVREDTVLYITTHLDDGRCLQASVSRLITSILEERDAPGIYFGVAFCVSHCAIIKVVKDAHTTTFSHTAALQFLPSFFAESPSTPGITALGRLGYRVDPALFVRAMELCSACRRKDNHKTLFAQGENNASLNLNCAALPFDLWQEIAFHLDLRDVLTIGSVSKLCREVASTVLRYPHVYGHRLVAVSKETPKPNRPLQTNYFSLLCTATFSATRAGTPATIFVGQNDWSENAIIPLYIKRPMATWLSVPVPVTVQPDARRRIFI